MIADDDVTLTHSVSGGDYDSASAADVTVTITETDTVELSIAGGSAAEDAGSVSFTVSLSQIGSDDVTVGWATANGTATAGDDYTAADGTLTFSPGETLSQTITVTIADDQIDEDDETFTVTLSDPANATLATATATGTITDDDTRGVTVSPQTLTMDEGGDDTYEVVLASQPTAEVTVSVSVPSDTDVSVDQTTLTFTASDWNTAQTVTVSAASDDDVIADDDVTLTHSVSGGDYDSASAADVTVTITETDTVELSIAGGSAAEDAGSVSFTVSLSQIGSDDVTVGWATTDGTATGDDYTAADGTLTFSPGETLSQTITVTIADDQIDEADETFTVTLSDPANATLATATATGTITDDDTRGVAVSPTALTMDEGGDDTYEVVLASQPTAEVTVSVSVPSDTDVSVDQTSLTFTADTWNTAQTVTVSAVDDDDVIADDDVTLTHSVSGGDYDGASADDVVVTITETDTVELSIAGESAAEDAGSISFTVSLNTESSDAVTVAWTTDDGTATAGDDYTAVSGTLTFSPGETLSQTITVTIADDQIDEADETFTVTLSDPANATLATATATGTITDDDTRGVAVSPQTLTMDEGSDDTYEVVLASQPTAEVTVSVSVPSDTDVSVDQTSLTFTADTWNAPQTVTVSAVDDDDVIADADVTLTHSVSGGDYDGASADDVVVTITETDTAELSIAGESAAEDAGSISFTVSLNTESSGDVTVGWTTDDGTATGDDYTAASGTLTFSPGETLSQTISVTIADDDVDEADETFTVTLSEPSNATLATATATATITDDDTRGVAVSPTALTVDEGSDDTYEVVLNSQPTADVTVAVSVPSDTDVSVDQTTLTFTANDWNTAQTVTVSAADDDDVIADDDVTLTHTVKGGDYDGQSASDVVVTIVETDTPTLSIADATAAEDAGSVSFTVSLSQAGSGDVTVAWATADGTATDDDYTAAEGTLKFSPGDALSQTIAVAITDDDVDEADETFTITLSEPSSSATLATASATATITDDDDPPAVSVADSSAAEDDGFIEFAVRLSQASGRNVMVEWATAADDEGGSPAKAGEDYLESLGLLVFEPGSREQTIRVQLQNDEEAEETETFKVELGNAEHATLEESGSTAVGTITDADKPRVTQRQTTGVCGRTDKVRVAIVAAAPVSACGDVTSDHLSAITSLDLTSKQISSLQDGDFAGLTGLTRLELGRNSLSSLPATLFSDLTSLTRLELNNNSLTSLPAGIFSGLTSLTYLSLNHNSLSSLPANLFSGLTSLTTLVFPSNDLPERLPAGIFSGLTSLQNLHLDNNQLPVSLKRVGEGQFKATVETGAPFAMTVTLTVTNGTLPTGTTSISIPQGSTESSTTLTVTRTDGTTSAVTVDIDVLPTPVGDTDTGAGHHNYTFVKSADLPIAVIDALGVCGRTAKVRDAIVDAVAGVTACEDVTATHLSAITSLSFSRENLASLQDGDFDGLTGLTTLNLGRNELSSLPSGVFSGLTSLTSLDLGRNELSSLPSDVFSGLTSLTNLDLERNSLSSLPAGVFSGLTRLTSLDLKYNSLSSLPAGVFSGLTSLWQLQLNENDLTSLPSGVFSGLTGLTFLDLADNSDLSTLPAGIFSGLTSLEILRLHDNSFDSNDGLATLPDGAFIGLTSLETLSLNGQKLPVALERVGAGQFKATMAAGAPFDVVLNIKASEGEESLDDFNVTIPQGSEESETVTVRRRGTDVVTVDISYLPLPPPNRHTEYLLSKAPGLPVQIHDAVVQVAVEVSAYKPEGWTGDPVVWSGNDAVFTVKRCDPATDASLCAAGITSALPVSVEVSGQARTVTIPANQYSVEITVSTTTATQDLSVNLVAADSYVMDPYRTQAPVDVRDAPTSTFFLTEAPESVAEGTAIDFTVARCGYIESVCFDEDLPAQTINLSVTKQGNFIIGTPPATLTFAAGVASTPLTVSTLDDVVDEDDGSITATIGASDGTTGAYEVGTPNSATVAVTDDDASLVLDIENETGTEVDGYIDFTVTLTKPGDTNDTERTVTVDYATASGTAVEGEDFLAASGTLTLDRATLSKTVRVSLVTDTHAEPQETFTLTLRNAVNATLEGGETTLAATGTIEANEAATGVSVTLTAPDHATEGENAVFTLTRGGNTDAQLVVEVEVQRLKNNAPTGDAVPHRVVFPTGQATATLTVLSVEDNDSLDPDRTLTARMTHETGNVQRVPIHDNDPPEISIEATGYKPEGWTGHPVIWEGDEAVFILKRCDPATDRCEGFWTPEELTVRVSGIGNSRGVTEVTLARGVFSTEVRRQTYNADSRGLQGYATARVQTGDGYTPAEDAKVADVLVYDVHPQTIRVYGLPNPVPEGTLLNYHLKRCRAIESVCFEEDLPAQTVNLSVTEEGSFIDGTPLATLSFREDALYNIYTVRTDDDAVAEDDGSVTATIADSTATSGPYLIHATESAHTIPVTDNDDRPRVSIENATVGESDGAITFPVTLKIPDGTDYSDQTVTVQYATASGTATQGTDYTAASGTLTFAPQETEQTITVTVIADDLSEVDETFTLTLSNANNAGLSGGGATLAATGTIVDDDLAHVSIAADADAVVEGQAAAFTLTRSANSTGALTVDVEVTTDDDPHGDLLLGTAPTTATFQAGKAEASLNVFTADNSRAQYNRAVKVTIKPRGATDYTVVTDASVASVAVRDNEKPHVTLTNYTSIGGQPRRLNEGDPVKLHLKRVGDLTVPLTVPLEWGIQPGQDWDTHFSTPRPQTATFPAGESRVTVTVPTDDDQTDERDINISGSILNPGSNTHLNLPYTVDWRKVNAGFLIQDDDGPQVTITANTTPVAESADAVFNLTRTSDSGEMPVQVALAQTGDFLGSTATPITVTFAAGNLNTALTVSLDDDDLDEDDGSVTATLVEDDAYEFGDPASATVVVTDDDDPQRVTIAAASTGTVEEGNNAVFTLTRRSLVNGQEVDETRGRLTVNVTVSQKGDFLTASPPTRVVFPSGDNEVTLRVPTVKDYVADGAGSVIVTLAKGVGYGIPAAGQTGRKASVTVTDDNEGQLVRIAAAAASVAEGSPVVFTLTRSVFTRARSLSGELRVSVDLSDPDDILSGTPTTATAVFNHGSSRTTLSLPTTDNDYVQDAPMVTATLVERKGYRVPPSDQIGRKASVRVNDNDGQVRVSISSNAAQVNEGEDVVFTLNRSGDPSGRLQVLLLLGGHAKILTDETIAKRHKRFTASFDGGQSSFDLRYTTEADEKNEGDGKIFLQIETSPTGSYRISGSRSKTVIVKDDDYPVLTMKESALTIDEGSRMGMTVIRTGDLTGRVHYGRRWSITRNHWNHEDYDGEYETNESITHFAPGQSESTWWQYPTGAYNWVGPAGGTAIYTILDDGCDETTEYCERPGYTVGEPSTTTYTINNKYAAVFIRPVSASVNEGDPAAFTLERRWNSDNIANLHTDVTIRVTQNGSVISGTSPTTQRFDAGDSEVTLSIPTQDDEVTEDDGAVTVEIVSPGPLNEQTDHTAYYPAGTVDGVNYSSATVTVRDDDRNPSVTVRALAESVVEGETMRFEFARTGAADDEMTFKFKVQRIYDYFYGFPGTSTGNVTWPAGDSKFIYTLQTVDRPDIDPDGAAVVTVLPPGEDEDEFPIRYIVGDPSEARTEIRNNDAARISIAATPERISEGETAVFTLTRTGVTDRAHTVLVSIDDPNKLAAVALPTSVSFSTGDVEKTASFATIAPDAVRQGDRTITATVVLDHNFEPPEGYIPPDYRYPTYLLGDPSGATVTVADAPLPTLAVSDTSASEADGNVTFTVKASGFRYGAISINYATAAGTATEGTDYTATSGTLTIASDEAQKTIEVPVTDDALAEAAETLTLTLNNPQNATFEGGGATLDATGAIEDDEVLRVAISAAEETVIEGSDARFTLSVSGATSTGDVEVGYTLSGTATAGTDYTAPDGTFTIDAGQASGTLAIPMLNDGEREFEETLIATLNWASNIAEVQLDATEAKVKIRDASTRIFLSLDRASVAENDDDKTVRVSASLNASLLPTATTVRVSVTGGTATAADFAPVNSFDVIIPANTREGSGTFTLAPVDDAVDEGDETITVSGEVTSLTPGRSPPLTVTSADLILTDDDAREVIVTPTELTIDEGSSKSYGIRLASQPTANVTVTVGVPSDTDVSATPTTLTFTAENYQTPQPVVVSAAADADLVSDPDVTLTNSVSSTGDYDGVTASSVTVTITETDERGVTVRPTELTVDEGGSETYEVVLTSQPTGNVTVTVRGASGDVSVNKTTLTFTDSDWDDAQTVTVSAAEDNDALADDKVTLSHTVAGADYGANSVTSDDVVVTITENDTPTLAIADKSAAEDAGAIAFTVTLSMASSQTVTASYATANGTATAGSDYTAVTNGTLTFSPGGGLSQTLTVSVADDDVDEANETFTVTLRSPQHATLSDASATGTIEDDDERGVTISKQTLTVTEGESGEYTVVLDSQPTANVTVTVGGASGDVTADTDTGTSGDQSALTFTASTWDDAQTVTVNAAEDDDALADATVTLTHTVAGGDYGTNSVTASSVTVTIAENDTPTLAIADTTAAEGDGNMVFRVSLSVASSQTVTVSYTTANGTATAGSDYTTVTNGTLTFSPNSLKQTVTVSVTDDDLDEANETLTVTLKSPQHATIATATATGTITDDDERGVTISESSLAVPEGDSNTYTVVLDSQPTAAVTVTVGGAAGDVTADTDTGTSGDQTALTFTTSTWNTAQTVTVSAAEDDDALADATVTLTHAVSGADYGTNSVTASSVVVTIAENDTPTLAIADTTAAEGDGNMVFRVSLSVASSQTVTASYTTANGTATAGEDYTTVSNGTLTFSPNSLKQTVTVGVADDDVDEANETFTVTLNSPQHATIATATATGTITDDDERGVTISKGTLTVTEGGSNTYTVVLDSEPTGAVTVTVGGAAGDVTTDTDTGTSGDQTALTFTTSTWNTAQTVTVSAAEDDDAVADATVTLTHTVAGGDYGTNSVTASSVVVTIAENDTPTLAIADTSAVEDAGNMVFRVSLSVASSQTVTVSYTTANGTATAGSDYTTVTNGTLTFSPNSLKQTVTVSVADDDVDEANETFTVTLNSPQHATIATATATGTITDDDERGVTISKGTLTVTEGGSNTYTVVLDSQPTADVTVTVGGASGDVTADTDTETSGDQTALTFTTSTWNTAQTVTVSAAEDDDAVADATVPLTHTVAGADYGTNSVMASSVTVTIVETDTPTLAIADTSAVEDAGNMVFRVSLSVASSQTVTASYVTANGTATAGSDYTAVSNGTLTFSPNSLKQTVTVSVADDDVDEANETFTVTLNSPQHATIATATATGTIEDDDERGVTISKETLTVNEGDSGEYTVVLDAQPTANVTVTVGGASGDVSVDTDTGTSGDQTTLTFTASDWDDAQTVTVSAAEDDDALADDKVTLTHTVAGGDYGTNSVTADAVVVTIAENDTPTLAIADTTAAEGDGSVVFRVSLSVASSQTVTASYVTANGTATAGSDYTAVLNGTLTFSPNSLKQTVTVSVADDDVDEANETFTVTLKSPQHATLADATATGTITDDDERGVTVSKGTVTVNEGDSGTYTVVLDSQPTANVTVTVGGASGDVSVDTDTGTSGDQTTLTFTASDWEDAQTVTVSAAEDDDAVADATVTLTHTVAGGDYGTNSVTASSVVVTIAETDTPTLAIADTTAAEGGGSMVFRVSLSVASSQTVTASYSSANGTATAGSDYTAVTNGTLTFSPNSLKQTVTVSVADDDVDEANETFTVTLKSPQHATLATATATGTITDDDERGVTVSTATLTVTEGGSNTYTVVLDSQPTANVTVTVGGASGDVTADTDTGTSGDQTALTFTTSTWNTAQTVTVSAAEDDDALADEKVTLTHTVAGGDYGTNSVTADAVVITIAENDTPTLAIADTTAAEGDGNMVFRVSLSVASSQTVTASYTTANGTATAGEDYTTVSNGTLTFSPNSLKQMVTVSVADDNLDEANETFTVTLKSPQHATISDATATATITDDDERGVTVSKQTLTVTEGGSNTYTVVLDSQPTGAVTVTVGGAAGDVTADTDTGTSGNQTALTFTASTWNTAQTVTVSAAEDDDAVADATVTLTHTVAGGDYGTNSVTADAVVITIAETDTPTLAIADTTAAEDAGSMVFRVSLSVASSQTVTASYATANGTATAGEDYTTVSNGTLTFSPNSLKQTVTVSVADDDLDEANETLTVTLKSPQHATIATAAATGTITDDDERGVTVSTATLTVTEGGSNTYTVVLDSQPTGAVTVTMGGASGDVTADTDTGTSGDQAALTFTQSNWSTAQTVTVSAAEDDDALADAKVTLTHTVAGADYGASSVTASNVVVTVAENETPTLAIADTTAAEDAGNLVFRVTLSLASSQTVTVGYATLNGTATAGEDYTAVSNGTLTFNPNTLKQTVTVSIADDDVDEANETFAVKLNSPQHATLATAAAIGAIIDDDERGVTISKKTLTVTEGSSGAYTVVLDSEPTANVTVTVGGAAGDVTADTDTETSGDQTKLTFTRSNWSTAQTVTVSAAEDDDALADAKVTLTHTVAGADYGTNSVTAGNVVVTIAENETPTLAISDTTAVEDDGSMVFRVSLSVASSQTVTVNYSTANGTATAGEDYTAVSNETITFSPNTLKQTVTVSVADDDVDEANETFTVTLNSPQNATLATATATGTIIDDETARLVNPVKPPPGNLIDPEGVLTVTLALTPAEIQENGGTTTVTAVLNRASTVATTVTVTANPESPASSSDYTQSGNALTVTVGLKTSTGTVEITAVDNDLDGPSKQVKVSGTASNSEGVASLAEQTLTITDDDERGVTVSTETLTVTEGGSNTYTVVLDSQPTANVTVTVGGAAGDVTADTDTETTGDQSALTFTASDWDDAQTVTVRAAEDDDALADDKVTLTHTVAGGDYGTNSVTASSVAVTIAENDTPTLAIADTTAAEGDGSMVFRVSLSVASSQTVTASYATANGTATAGSDYTTVSNGTLTFSPNSLKQTLTVSVTDDDLDEANETFTVTLKSPQHATLSDATATGTITDDDERGVTISKQTLTVNEGDSGEYTVVLDSKPTANVTVTVGGTSGDVTADTDTETTGDQSALTFTASDWDDAQTVTVRAAEDDDALADATVTLTHAVSGGDYGTNSVTADDVVVTVAENDTPTLAIADTTAAEGGGSMVFRVSLSVASSQTVTVRYTTANGTATAGEDYTAVSNGTLTFSPNSLKQTVTVSVSDDDVDEANETFTVTLKSPQHATIATATATGTITDDDKRGVTVSPTALTVPEGGNKTYTVVLDSQPTANVTVTVGGTSGDVTADTDADNTGDQSALMFTASDWDDAQTVTVRAAEDDDALADATVTLTHVVSGGDYGTNSVTADDVVVTVAENDTPTLSHCRHHGGRRRR